MILLCQQRSGWQGPSTLVWIGCCRNAATASTAWSASRPFSSHMLGGKLAVCAALPDCGGSSHEAALQHHMDNQHGQVLHAAGLYR